MNQITCAESGRGIYPLLNRIVEVAVLLLTLIFSPVAFVAQSSYNTPAGRWRTFSDATGKENGGVEIVDNGGELLGHLIAGHSPDFATKLCAKCPGERHNKPMKGLLILSGVRHDGEEWGGGEILDPDNGKVYRVRLRLTDGGKKLLVRGYLGFSLFGRTETWVRME